MEDEVVLAARSLVYSVIARAFVEEPDEVMFKALCDDTLDTAIELVDDDLASRMMSDLHDIKVKVTRDGGSFCTSCISDLSVEYTAIFVGPKALLAPPWESSYVKGRNANPRGAVLEVRDAYKRAGLLPARYRQVADDHVGLELDFMAKLARFALDSYQSGEKAECMRWLGYSADFLSEHLLVWMGNLAESIKRAYGSCFYASVADLAALYIRRDVNVLAAFLEEEDDLS